MDLVWFWRVLVSASLVLMSLEQIKLRREVSKCLRILYAAAEADCAVEVEVDLDA